MEIDFIQIKKILVIQLRAIGDVVLTTPVLPILEQHFPNAKIFFLTSFGIHKLLENLDLLDGVLCYPTSIRNPFKYVSFLRNIRKEGFDLVVDYQGTPGTAFITKISGARIRLSWKMDRRRWAYNYYSPANKKDEYVPIQKCKMLEEIGIHQLNTNTKIHITEENRSFIDQFLKKKNIDRNKLLINISPKGKRPARQWEADKFAQLTDLLIDKYGAIVFYSWTKGEEEYARHVASLSRNKPLILPQWPLSIFAAFLSQVDLHFSYDNGPKHLAIASGTATLSLFATDSPKLWNLNDHLNHPFIIADVPCVSCRLRQCDLMICMKQIQPEEVLRKIEDIPIVRNKLKSQKIQ